jgi:predicted amidohydrolase YtcJ/thiol-disulfide isomerase/thioredoxin
MNRKWLVGMCLVAVCLQAADLTEQEKAIVGELKTLRKVPDEQRGAVTKHIALEIRNLAPDGSKVGLASGLASLSTEGDFGHDTLQEVGTTLAEALREQPAQQSEPYLELAQLVRYEHVETSLDNAQFKTAMETLEANDRDRQRADFTLNDLSGKGWTLKSLRGHIVLVNFWATWCPPCRKEMPDLDSIYKQYKDQGLIVLAISDEEQAKVTAYLAQHAVSYPVLLDAGRKVNEAFHVDGIPKSFIYDREGELVAQSIDMRTRGQFMALLGQAGLKASAPMADVVYRNGVIFTSNAQNGMAEALAVRDGRIVYVGGNAGVGAFVGAATRSVDLKGRFLMPGLIDGHMHPLEAGMELLKCNLDYESLTVPQLQSKVQACLDHDGAKDSNSWLEVVNWFQESMLPAGVKTSRATLDALKTTRPILVRSSFGHTVLANSRAIELAKVTAKTPEPVGGKIWRDAAGEPTGLFEDSAFAVFITLLPTPTPADNAAGAVAALQAMNKQGVTSFLDAIAPEEQIVAFATAEKSGQLTSRAHFAPLIEPSEVGHVDEAIARVVGLAKKYDEGRIVAAPGITVRNAKLFLDGVIAAPALTGAMMEPYYENSGTAEKPDWAPGKSRGPAVYFASDPLAEILVKLGKAGIDPHMHADGDGAVHAALNGIAVMRKELPGAEIRPAIAHDEIVDRSDFARYKELNATPVLSMQWEKPAGDTLGLVNYFGSVRMKILEPAGFLAAAGARIAFGSDWPVDRLDEWFALKVGVTRTNAPDAGAEFRGRLGDDPGLSRVAVLRAATINAAFELHEDDATGSLEVGKCADLIVLDRDPLKVAAEEIAGVKVLQTVVGGKVVYQGVGL